MQNNLQLVKSSNFGTVQCDIYSDDKEMFMTSEQLGNCLGYANPRESVNKLVQRNEYLRSAEFSAEVKMTSPQGTLQNTRIFTEDGIYEVTMLAKTEKAKEFRAWVRKLLKSLRKGESTLIETDKLKKIEAKAKQDRATAMLLNAQCRMMKMLMSNTKDKNLSQIAVDVMNIKSVEQIVNKDLGEYLPQCERTYSATEVGKMLGISANKVGKIANTNGLKTDEYGITVMDKSKYSSKEVASFRYNQHGIDKISEII